MIRQFRLLQQTSALLHRQPFPIRQQNSCLPSLSNAFQLRQCSSLSNTSPPKPSLSLDALPAYPTPTTLGLLRLGDYVGTVSFAHSGALLAGAAGMDLLGATMVGTITAIGGGTIRDALILNKVPFWTDEIEYFYLSLLTASATFLWYSKSKPGLDREESTIEFVGDTIGIGSFCVIGAMNGVRLALPGAVCVLCGMATATFGGVVRDVLVGRKVRILHSRAEIYASAAAGGGFSYLVARRLGAGVIGRVGAGFSVATALRAWAWARDIRLPVWQQDVPSVPKAA